MTNELAAAPETGTDQELIFRSFDVEMEATGDGRTVDLRVVPYNEPATVADPPDYQPYQEVWLPGVFDRQLNAANRVNVLLNFEHQQGIGGVIGHGLSLREASDGFYGSFRMSNNNDGDKALELISEDILRGVSLEAKPLRSRTVNGRVERVKAHLDKVALCRTGLAAFESAQVLAVRQVSETEPIKILNEMIALGRQYIDAEPDEQDKATMRQLLARLESYLQKDKKDQSAARQIPLLASELSERLERLGVTPLQRMAVSRKPWDGSAGRFTDEQYQASCLIDRGGDGSPKVRCSLPVLEPDGSLNVNALAAAAGALQGARTNLVGVTQQMKVAAARKLLRYYRLAGMTPPAGIVTLAQS
jgi:HK97 family phage prohead protease